MFPLVFLDAFFVPFLGRQVTHAIIKQLFSTNYKVFFINNKMLYFIVWFFQIMQKKMVKIAKEGKKMEASSLEIYGKMHVAFVQMDPHPQVL